MKSLRGALTIRVWVTIGVVGAVSAVIAIWQAQRETQGQVDYQMQQVAQIVAGQSFAPGDQGVELSDARIFPFIHVHHVVICRVNRCPILIRWDFRRDRLATAASVCLQRDRRVV